MEYLPAVPEEFRISLGEGNTPLVRSRSIGAMMGVPELYFKLENINPSGSYKDRFAAPFVSLLKSEKQQVCLATSSGNTGAALAAYCAAADIDCILAIVDGAPLPKIKQMQLYGAHTYMVHGFGKNALVTSQVFDLLETLSVSWGIPLPVSAYKYCPQGMMGVQTIACEILEDLAVDHIFSPAGGGGLTLAIAKGCIEFSSRNAIEKLPRVNCVQPAGNDTIATSLREGKAASEIEASTTSISGLQVPGVLDGNEVIDTCRHLGGNGYVVKDQEVFRWHKFLAQKEGIFVSLPVP